MKEEDIRPKKLFEQYLSLAEEDARSFFLKSPFYYGSCPACRSFDSTFRFRKMKFDYEECNVCGTLYANPRPAAKSFDNYYQDSPSVRFWATNFYKETETSRRERLIRPKAIRVKQIIDTYVKTIPRNAAIADIGAGYGVFCEELKKIMPEHVDIFGIEPASSLQEILKAKKIPTIPKFLSEVKKTDFGKKKIIAATSFELLEHLHDPQQFISQCNAMLESGSLLILTTLNWHGFDLQVLQHRSNSIHPPHHINFFTTDSLGRLLKDHGFEIVDVSTPGQLDVDIAFKQSADVEDAYIKNTVFRDELMREKLQVLLQETRMSSHMMIVAKKK